MAYKEPHFDKAGAKAFVDAFTADNAATLNRAKKKPAAAKKSPAKAPAKAPKKK